MKNGEYEMGWDWEKLQEQRKAGGGHTGGVPPQMDEVFNKLKEMKFGGGPILIVLALAAIYLTTSMIYTVGVDEVGVVQRFGRYTKMTNPGLNFKLPNGIEKVTKVPVRRVNNHEFGFRSINRTALRHGSETEDLAESLMLTGDLNVAVVPWIVQYLIRDPYSYLFKVNNPEQLLRDMSEAAMRQVVGDRSVNEVINNRKEIADEAILLLQHELDKAETGIQIRTVELKKTNVPGRVQPSFNEVNQSVQEKEKMVYQAREDYNREIPKAIGEADRMIKSAEGYRLERINRAKGDASRFLALYEEYQKAKDVTRRRLYQEAMKDLFPKMGPKYIIDSDQKNVLPFLNLGNQDGMKP